MIPLYDDGWGQLYHGDAREVLAQLPAESVQCCVTSPPYWALRQYQGAMDSIWGGRQDCEHEWGIELPAHHLWQVEQTLSGAVTGVAAGQTRAAGRHCSLCGAWRGQFGAEPTVELYVSHTVEILRLIKRVLRKDGVCWWNIGDSYCGSGQDSGKRMGQRRGGLSGIDARPVGIASVSRPVTQNKQVNLKPKDLCLIPFRVALAAQADGWYVRSVIIWEKPNCMPESVTDRPTDSHEYILMLTKSARYYWDQEAVREPAQQWGTRDRANGKHREAGLANGLENDTNPAGRNIRSVWLMNTAHYSGPHFATYPEELPRKCIMAASKQGDTILDPFAGTGTTIAVAKSLARQGLGIEISKQYCQLAISRIQSVSLPMPLL